MRLSFFDACVSMSQLACIDADVHMVGRRLVSAQRALAAKEHITLSA